MIKKAIAWINRKFTLWRLRPARLTLNEEFSHGRINSQQLHRLDASMLKRSGFKYAAVAAICVSAFSLQPSALGQIFVGGVPVTGTSNAVVQYNFVTVTNLAYSTLIGRTLAIQNITTNETITVAYGFVFPGMNLTNLYILATNQYTFPASNGWVQGQTFTTNISAINFSVPVIPVGQIMLYTNAGASAYSNNVIFQ